MSKTKEKAKKPSKKPVMKAAKKTAEPKAAKKPAEPKVKAEVEKAEKPAKAAKAELKAGEKPKKGKRGKKKAEPLTAEQTESLKNDIAAKYSSSEKKPYRMNETFEVNVIIEHPKFGVGQVIAAFPHKIDVQFGDMVRALVHNRNFN